MTATRALEAVTLRAGNGPERAFYFRPDTSDPAVINDVFRNGGYDLRRLDRTAKQRRHAEIVAFVEREQQRTGKRPLIIDAGANVGAAALQFLSNFPNARIVSIEDRLDRAGGQQPRAFVPEHRRARYRLHAGRRFGKRGPRKAV